MVSDHGEKNRETLSEGELTELFEILRALREKSEQQNRQIAELERSLEQARRGRWVDWTAGAVVGLALTILAKLVGLPV